MAEYTITDPKGIRIKSLLLSDIQGMHTLLKKEGCIDSENKFSDEQKAIALDEVQTRIAQQNKTDTELKSKLSSSKSLVLSDDYTYANAFYVLFKQSVLTPTQYNRLKRLFSGKPQFRFVNAIEFWKLFE